MSIILYPQPSVSSPLPDGTVNVSVYDYKAGCSRNVKVKPEEADEFISSRTEKIKKQNNKQNKVFCIIMALGTLTGALIGLKSKSFKKYFDLKTTTSSILNGALIGSCGGSVLGLGGAASVKSSEKVDQELCQDFIDKHTKS